MITYALDSNIISYALKRDSQIRKKIVEVTDCGDSLVMPYIVYFEVKRWLLEIGAKSKRLAFDRMLNNDIILKPLDKVVWDIAAALYVKRRKAGNPVSDADLLIAAFAISNGCILVTNNIRHFADIEGLRIENWK